MLKRCLQCGVEKPREEFNRDRPLDVRWLCSFCHARHHAAERDAA